MSLAKENAKKRRRKTILWSLAALLALGGARFAWMRHADKDAWPERSQSVRLALTPPASGWHLLFTPERAESLLANYPAPSDALTAEYRRYQAFGVSATNSYPEIEGRVSGPGLLQLAELNAFEGFDPSGGAMAYNEFIGRSSEFFVMLAYLCDTQKLASNSNHVPPCSLLPSAINFTKGGGLIGRYAALNNAMLLVRATIMDPPDFSAPGAAAEIQRLRALENEIGGLDDAFRADHISITNTIDKVYADLAGAGGRIVSLLGGEKEQSIANIDALFTRFIENSALPYSPYAITTNLPPWCAGKGRAPSTRDPIGAAVAQSYIRYASFAHAVGPSIILELRAARVALALEARKAAAGEYPETLDALLDAPGGLLSAADIADPFAPADAPAPLSYARDGDGWRFWSAGLDQQNDGGTTDAFRSPTGKAQKAADIIFLSRERELRIADASL